MSRTQRKNHCSHYFLTELEDHKAAIKYLLKTNDVDFFIDTDNSNHPFKYIVSFKARLKVAKLSTKKEQCDALMAILKEELIKATRNYRIVNSDRYNWFGGVKNEVKAYSHKQSRSGKRELTSKVLRKAELNNLDALYDELLFDEPNLGQIKGAIWFFD